MSSGFWTEDRIERLKRMWADGYHGSKIGAELGCSRNAAIGKVHRLGLAMRDPPPGSNGQRHFKPAKRLSKRNNKMGAANYNQPRKVVTTFQFGKPPPDVPVEPYVPIPDDLDIPPNERKSLMDLEPNDCRWPIGDPQEKDFGFCGKPKLPGTSYCSHHASRAFVPVEVARRVRKAAKTRERAKERVDA